MITSHTDASIYYKVVINHRQTDSLIYAVFIHTNEQHLAENYLVLTLTHRIKHSHSVAKVFSFVDNFLPKAQTKIITWTPPHLQQSELHLRAPLCIEIDHKNARKAMQALFASHVLSKAQYHEICQGLDALDQCVANTAND